MRAVKMIADQFEITTYKKITDSPIAACIVSERTPVPVAQTFRPIFRQPEKLFKTILWLKLKKWMQSSFEL